MAGYLPGPVRGALSILLTVVNTFFWLIPIIPVALIKFLVPATAVRKVCDKALNAICTIWANCNKFNLDMMKTTTWDITVADELSMDDWYLVLSNHQSWADILALQYTLNNRIPYFRFFLKKQLMWFPVLNFVWWALDYPVMERYSKEFLEKNPQLKGKDLEKTRKSCERFKRVPVAVMNFVEGTRFTEEKREQQKSPFKRLLNPKAGGVAFVLAAMGEQLTGILDVTIAYPGGAKQIWPFLCGEVPMVKVVVKTVPLSDEIIGDYADDEQYRERFRKWINDLWTQKDEALEELIGVRSRH
jgi:1-acyl-sn-glycerol-3-phosphate acyltransferase